jgi:phosphoribosylglycinamide formyltransferase-1
MSDGRRSVGILISGRGTNMQALIEAAKQPDYAARVAVVVSNRPDAAGLERAKSAGIATAVVPHRDFANREDFEAALTSCLRDHAVDFVCQAGFMRVVTRGFVDVWRDRLINIHPSLLPSFPGLHTHARALAAGVKLHGCTVHFVREAVDDGPIIGQAAVPVNPSDTPDTLAARVLQAEHLLYPRCLALVATGRVRVENERVVGDRLQEGSGVLINPPD